MKKILLLLFPLFVFSQNQDNKTLVVYKSNFKLIDKDISYDDFVKLASENK